MGRKNQFEAVLRVGLYPALLLATLVYAVYEVGRPAEQLGASYPLFLGSLVTLLILVETLHPLRDQWRMTRETFWRRDLPFLLIGSLTVAAANAAGGLAIVHLGLARGESHASLPLVPAVVLAIAIPDLLWYWLHRLSHEAKGPVGRWLWRTHVAHHLPGQLYVLMHAVAHPINTVAVRIILTVPLFFLGFSTEALFVAQLIGGLQGLVSHLNFDLRLGWMNYVLTGPELHRYHHSADVDEAKNYAATLPLWDIVFGTFVYRPGVDPAALGVGKPAAYPGNTQFLRTLALPFRSESRQHDAG
jgi:sterol desaturase/sphingolipid hydroxylase (fatty acid hydroxylase superfamily)